MPPRIAVVKLLVVDEDPNFARILATVLGGEGHEVEAVGGVDAAPPALARLRPDVLLLAVDASDSAALAFLAGFRTFPGGSGAVAVAMVGRDDERVRHALGASDSRHVLVRPFSVLDLAELVRSVGVGNVAPPRTPAPPAALDIDNASRLVRLWARHANGIVQLALPGGTEWATLADGGLVEAGGEGVVRAGLVGGDLEFQPCEVDGTGDRAAMAEILWSVACAGERPRPPLPRGTVLSPTSLSERAGELPLAPGLSRALRTLTTPIGFGRFADELGLDVGELQRVLGPLATLGFVVLQDVPALSAPVQGPPGHASIVPDRVTPARSTATGGGSSYLTNPAARSGERPRLPVSTPSGAPRQLPPQDEASILRVLRREVALVRSGDAWVILGVPHDAAASLVQAAGERMRARYRALVEGHTGEIHELATTILAAVDSALASAEPPPARAEAPGDDLFRAGLRAMSRGEWALADRRFCAARDQNLDSPKTLAHIGWARVHNPDLPATDRAKDGLELLLLAEQFAPDYPDGQYFLAMVLHRAGDDDGALRRLRRALKAEPGHVAANALARKLRRAVPPVTR